MELIQQIESDFIQALKSKQEAELLALRGLKSAIKNAEIAKRPDELTEIDVLKIMRGEIKKCQDAIDLYHQGERPDLVAKEAADIQIIQKYLPQELSETELKKIIAETAKKLNAASPSDFGKLMGAVMKQVDGQADGEKVSRLVKEVVG